MSDPLVVAIAEMLLRLCPTCSGQGEVLGSVERQYALESCPDCRQLRDLLRDDISMEPLLSRFDSVVAAFDAARHHANTLNVDIVIRRRMGRYQVRYEVLTWDAAKHAPEQSVVVRPGTLAVERERVETFFRPYFGDGLPHRSSQP